MGEDRFLWRVYTGSKVTKFLIERETPTLFEVVEVGTFRVIVFFKSELGKQIFLKEEDALEKHIKYLNIWLASAEKDLHDTRLKLESCNWRLERIRDEKT